MNEKAFTANCISEDGETIWAVYFMTETLEQAENVVEKLGLCTDKQGVCELVEVIGNQYN